MDSEHRHELEQNDLATWLTDKVEAIKPQLPLIGVGLVALVAAIIGMNSWKASAEAAKADRWRDFSVAVEGVQPNLSLLKEAAEANPGTTVEEWSEVTWADGRLFQASRQYFSNRDAANTAIDEAIEVYQRMVTAKDRKVAERAKYQLARAYELQGKLDEAKEQYGKVTGAFAEVAVARAEELDSTEVQAAYEWITATKTASATATTPSGLTPGDLTPDDIDLPLEDADATLQGLLDEVEDQVNEAGDPDQESDSTEGASEEASSDESAAEEATEEASQAVDEATAEE